MESPLYLTWWRGGRQSNWCTITPFCSPDNILRTASAPYICPYNAPHSKCDRIHQGDPFWLKRSVIFNEMPTITTASSMLQICMSNESGVLLNTYSEPFNPCKWPPSIFSGWRTSLCDPVPTQIVTSLNPNQDYEAPWFVFVGMGENIVSSL